MFFSLAKYIVMITDRLSLFFKIHMYIYTHTNTHQKSRNTFRSKSKPMISPETTNVFVKASNPLT